MKEIRLKARAKINISLDILGKRENGYHDVEMIMQTVDLYDRLILRLRKDNKVKMKTNLPYLPIDNRNLVVKVIEYMMKKYNLNYGVNATLFKVIPVAAGLAGGSSDAAQAIIGMNTLFSLGLSMDEMLEIGGKFGSDIPYCLLQGTALATGLGEKITLLNPFPDMFVLIVKPKFSMSTATVYQNFDLNEVTDHPDTQGIIQGINNQDLDFICNHLCNVLETVTPKLHPSILDIKKQLLSSGASGVLMSGSGPSVYGLYKEKRIADKALTIMKKDNKMQFVYLTTIHNRKKG